MVESFVKQQTARFGGPFLLSTNTISDGN